MTLKAKVLNGQKLWKKLVQPQPFSLEYRQWRDRLLRCRFWLAVGLAVAYFIIQGLADFYEVFVNPERLLQNLQLLQSMDLLPSIRQNYILHKVIVIVLLICLTLLWRNRWVRRYPAMMLILLPWAVSFIPEIVLGAFVGIPRYPSLIMFMAQVAIAPVHWRLHLISQAVPILFYFLVYPLIGLATFAERSIYSFSYTVEVILVCLICEVGVYLFERSKQSELAANRRLRLFIHSITHDLRTPVMGSLMLLQSIHDSTPMNQPVQMTRNEMEQLIQGSDHLLSLMNRLLSSQTFSEGGLALHRQPTNLSALVTKVLQELQSSLVKQQIQLNNQFSDVLPLVNVDAQQIERVFNNLISNAISHNPAGIVLTLNATICSKNRRLQPMLKVIVQDNGIGISPDKQNILFEPYTRGEQSQYTPGLGLGLHICHQVIEAHGGNIGIESPGQGTKFWFTLPLE